MDGVVALVSASGEKCGDGRVIEFDSVRESGEALVVF